MKHNHWLFMLSPYFGQSELKVLLSHNPRGEAIVCVYVCVTETFIIFKVTLESSLTAKGKFSTELCKNNCAFQCVKKNVCIWVL